MRKFVYLSWIFCLFTTTAHSAGIGSSGGDLNIKGLDTLEISNNPTIGKSDLTVPHLTIKKSFTVNGSFDGTLLSIESNKATIYQVNKDVKNPSYQMLSGSKSTLELLNQAYKKYNLNSKNLDKISGLLNSIGSTPTTSQIQKLESLNFKLGFSGSKSFLIDENSKYIVPLK